MIADLLVCTYKKSSSISNEENLENEKNAIIWDNSGKM